MNLHVKMYNLLLLASVDTLINVYFVSLPQGTFDCSSNATTKIRILCFFFIFALADVSFQTIIFRSRVYITFY